MNYIAHLHIAKLTQTSYAGNLLGDFPWQPDPNQSELWQGWRLHQAIDTFVDAHPQSELFKTLPRAGRRRFAGIVQDILMDYWLVRLWSQYDDQSFDHFAVQAVAELSRDKFSCPKRLQCMIASLEQENWLADLGTDWGVVRAIRSIQRRWPHGHHLEPFIAELPLLLTQAKEPFLLLYPDVIEEARRRGPQVLRD